MAKKKDTTIMKKPETEYYGMVRWAAADVQSLRPDWTLERCEEELRGIEKHLQDRLVELGYEVMDTLLANAEEETLLG